MTEWLIAIEFHIQKEKSEKAETPLIAMIAQKADALRGKNVSWKKWLRALQ